ncbi:hypothetical protein EJ06DRAFT_177899 [Trichodelitschia bisporula]|uniref:Uncharacterized protein n=1 Tax=Trichodelitschia bisporula TaxID=703511 RepID=A0A6G1HLG6_9PEZI|nr:hypothetical protein EJ06DRAFT_177899 [Trichodelitschia bisporula]
MGWDAPPSMLRSRPNPRPRYLKRHKKTWTRSESPSQHPTTPQRTKSASASSAYPKRDTSPCSSGPAAVCAGYSRRTRPAPWDSPAAPSPPLPFPPYRRAPPSLRCSPSCHRGLGALVRARDGEGVAYAVLAARSTSFRR